LKASKKLVNLAAAAVAIGVIGVAVCIVYQTLQVDVPQYASVQEIRVVHGKGPAVPRTIVVTIANKAPATVNAEAVTSALRSLDPVKKALFEPPASLRLTIVAPLQYSRLSELLTDGSAERSPLDGALRLHVSGMT
jgi:hypothetical protein